MEIVCRDVHELEAFVKHCIRAETDVEAGYVNDPHDLGKETNHGITVAKAKEYHKELVKLFNWNGSMRDLTVDMAYYIYRTDFWNKLLLNKMATEYSKVLAQSMFRWAIKSGQTRPVEHLQRTLNILNNRQRYYKDIVDDGWMGKRTYGAIDSLIRKRGDDAVPVLTYMINSLQAAWMYEISLERKNELNERFSWGWITRCARESAEYAHDYGIIDV